MTVCVQVQQTLHPAVAEIEQDCSRSITPVTELSNRILDTSFDEKGTRAAACADGGGKAAAGGGGGIGLGPEAILLNGTRSSHKRRSSDNENRDTKRQYSLERRDESPERSRDRERQRDRDSNSCRSKTPFASSSLSSSTKANTVVGTITLDSDGIADDGEAVSPETNLRCLVNFFR